MLNKEGPKDSRAAQPGSFIHDGLVFEEGLDHWRGMKCRRSGGMSSDVPIM
jgi:hypothetical protein